MEMKAPLSPEELRELWTQKGASPEELRAALALSEAALAIRSVLAAEVPGRYAKASLTPTGLIVDSGRHVPTRYFVGRIDKYAGLQRAAQGFWDALRRVLIDGKAGLSGLHVDSAAGDEVSLVMAEELAQKT
jgi:hypothetical protein